MTIKTSIKHSITKMKSDKTDCDSNGEYPSKN